MAEEIFAKLRDSIEAFLSNRKDAHDHITEIGSSIEYCRLMCERIGPDMRKASAEVGGLISRIEKKHAVWLPIAKKIVPLQAQLEKLKKSKGAKEQIVKLEKQIGELDSKAARHYDEIIEDTIELAKLEAKHLEFAKAFVDL